MTPHADSQHEIREYLLGGLDTEARRRVEERLLTEDAFMEELSLAEEELIDDYVGRRLDKGARADFERLFLSTEERREQLRFAQALGRYVDAHAPEGAVPAGAKERKTQGGPTFGEKLSAIWGSLSPAGRGALALAAVAVVVLALWLVRGPGEPRTFYTLALTAAAGDRAGGAPAAKVPFPLGADALMVTLNLPEGAAPPAARYRAELLRDGRRAGAAAVSAQDARSVTVVVSGAELTRGRYALRLSEVGADGAERRVPGSYFFDVE